MKPTNLHIDKYPMPIKPETWALNDVYLNIIEEKLRYWKDKGYSWKFGQEIEFVPKSIGLRTDFAANTKEGYKAVINDTLLNTPLNRYNLPLLQRDRDPKKLREFLHESAEKLKDYIRNMPDLAEFEAKTEKTLSYMISELETYQQQVCSEDLSVQKMGHYNIYAAHLFTHTSDEGGIRDLIRPRFGSILRSDGWWDDLGVIEFCTEIENDPFEFIDKIHLATQSCFSMAHKFNVAPFFDVTGSHFNFSLWKNDKNGSPSHNIMDLQTDSDLEHMKNILTGIFGTFIELPHLIHDCDHKKRHNDIEISANWGRGNTFRQAPGRTEFRRNHNTSFVHIARDIALILSGAAYGCFEINDPEIYRENKHIQLDEVRHATYEPPSYVAAPDFYYLMTFSDINAHGYLEAEETYICRKLNALIDTIGEDNIGLYSCNHPETHETVQLDHPYAWVHMLSTVKYTDDDQLDISHLPEELQLLFGDFKNGRIYRAIKTIGETPIESNDRVLFTHCEEYQNNSPAFWFMLGNNSSSAFNNFYSAYYKKSANRILDSLSNKFKLHIASQCHGVISEKKNPYGHLKEKDKEDIKLYALHYSIDELIGLYFMPYIKTLTRSYRNYGDAYLMQYVQDCYLGHQEGQTYLKGLWPDLKSQFEAEAKIKTETYDSLITSLSLKQMDSVLPVGNSISYDIMLYEYKLISWVMANQSECDVRRDARFPKLVADYEDMLYCQLFVDLYSHAISPGRVSFFDYFETLKKEHSAAGYLEECCSDSLSEFSDTSKTWVQDQLLQARRDVIPRLEKSINDKLEMFNGLDEQRQKAYQLENAKQKPTL